MGMGVDSELLLKASEKGLTITEVPIRANYKDLDTSTHNPLYHGLDVLSSVIKYVSIRHPLPFYGLPGLVGIIIGVVLGLQAFEIFASSGEFPPNLGIIAVAADLAGILLLSIGIILFTLITVLRERS